MQTPSLSHSIPVLDAAKVRELIASSERPVIVDVTDETCVPCQFLKPVLQKIAIELADDVTIVELADATSEAWPYTVEAIPTLLIFRNGELVRRETGFHDLDRSYRVIAEVLALGPERNRALDDPAFRRAFTEAQRRMEEIMQPASDALTPHMEAIEPEWQAIQQSADARVARGEMTRREAGRLIAAEWKRLSAPFAHLQPALSAAQAAGLAAFREHMTAAVARFASDRAPAPQASMYSGVACRPGDPFCYLPGASAPREHEKDRC
jgi:thioredoxin 1